MIKIILFSILALVCFSSPEVQAQTHHITSDNINFRRDASTSSPVLGHLYKNTQLQMEGEEGDFYKVKVVSGDHNGLTGYVSKDFVSEGPGDGPPPAATAVTSSSAGNVLGSPICGCSGCRVGSPYGMRRHPIKKTRLMHHGCDVPAPRGTIVRAAADGVVESAGTNGGYGKMVVVKHASIRGVGNNVRTRYAHLWKISVNRGQRVRKGQEVGKVDSTGSSTGHHLHFEVRKSNGGSVNPQSHVNMNPRASCSSGGSSGSAVAQ